MLHGWGMNSAVFTPLQEAFTQYRVHNVDLPGFGFSSVIKGDIDAWVDAIIDIIPDNSIWLGWSLGGLIASRAACRYPEKIKALITIASSPYFMAQESTARQSTKENTGEVTQKNITWPGMAPQLLEQFHHALSLNLSRTINQFLSIQAMGSQSAKSDIKQLKALIDACPQPKATALTQGLNMLARTDLRQDITRIEQPWLRIWGRLDGLVPQAITSLMPQKASIQDVIIPKASHAPFISHPQVFIQAVHLWLDEQR
ncbi:pimeloyl-ACP methyl ester esterase BioH [Shewanella surugensis]|uniref:Pimeloyl-[acyl-carrier protein] methyl ester esterase n=1 Tax=Shewanella surugensis TaxID=212020 RepID=A0ABT0LH97_9GAMM|nr:pimeloyl-ACP methyl ester esterase BioH [Shewanella surugensis]MCL1126939.1 pimeloyl-ACP methyl ester esterase BioH [Shewanella surugensis]